MLSTFDQNSGPSRRIDFKLGCSPLIPGLAIRTRLFSKKRDDTPDGISRVEVRENFAHIIRSPVSDTSLTRDSHALSRDSHRSSALVSTTFDAKTRITTLELHGIASNDRDSASNSDVDRKRKSTSGPGAL